MSDSLEKVVGEVQRCANMVAVAEVIDWSLWELLNSITLRLAALQAKGEPDIDHAMVLRACNAYDEMGGGGCESNGASYYPAMHAAIKAAREQGK